MQTQIEIADDEELEPISDAFLFPIERIVPQIDQPRSTIKEESIDNIATSIRNGLGKRVAGTGLIHPLLVRWVAGAIQSNGQPKKNARVEIVAGETRYWACKKVGLTHVPVIISDQDSEEAYEDALIENILRGDLPPEKEGQGFLHLKNKLGLTTEKLAVRLYGDISRVGYINNRLDMTRLNPIVQQLVSKREDSMTAARRIQTLKNESTQKELVDYMISGGTFKELDKKIKEIKGQVDTGQTPAQKREENEMQQKLRSAFPVAAAQHDADKTNSQSSDAPSETGDNSPSPKVNALPRIDVSAALQSIEAQLETVADVLAPIALPPAKRAEYRQQIERLRAGIEKVEAQI